MSEGNNLENPPLEEKFWQGNIWVISLESFKMGTESPQESSWEASRFQGLYHSLSGGKPLGMLTPEALFKAQVAAGNVEIELYGQVCWS